VFERCWLVLGTASQTHSQLRPLARGATDEGVLAAACGDEAVADGQSGMQTDASGQFQNRERAKSKDEASGTDAAPHLHHPSIARDANDVDREAHAKGVHALAGRDDQPSVGRQSLAPEEPFSSRGRVDRQFNRSDQPLPAPFDLQAPPRRGIGARK